MELNLPDQPDVKMLLDHASNLFRYHAGQRLDSIRNFFTAFGVFLVADVTAHNTSLSFPNYTRIILDMTILVTTLIFFGLDYRNSQLVKFDEDALKAIEKSISDKYQIPSFDICNKSERPKQIRKYKIIVPLAFSYFVLLFSAILVWDSWTVF